MLPRIGQGSKAQLLFRRQTIRPTIHSPSENGPRTLVASANKDGGRAGWAECLALYGPEQASGIKEKGPATPPLLRLVGRRVRPGARPIV
jgi:hypothetical protein